MQQSTPVPASARAFAGVLGVLFVGIAVVILGTSASLDWQAVLAALVVAAVGLDFLLGAARGRWPRLALALFLP